MNHPYINHAEHDQIVKTAVDREGNLRLYRRSRAGHGWTTRQVALYPAGSWETALLDQIRVCTVGLTPPVTVRSPGTGGDA